MIDDDISATQSDKNRDTLEPAASKKLWKCLGCGNKVYTADAADQSTATQKAFEENNGQCCSGFSYDKQLGDYDLFAAEDIIQWLSNKEQSLRATANRPIEEVGNEKHDAEVKANLLAKLQEEFSEDMRSKNDDK